MCWKICSSTCTRACSTATKLYNNGDMYASLPFATDAEPQSLGVSWLIISVKEELTSLWSFFRHCDRQCKRSLFPWLLSVKTCRNSTKLPLLPVSIPVTAIFKNTGAQAPNPEDTTWQSVVPKSYRSEGQLRSTRSEFPSRVVFGNCRLFQYGGLYQSQNMRIASGKTMLINKTSTFYLPDMLRIICRE